MASPSSPPSLEAPAKPRLMITKMQLENFKSYGGVQEIGLYHHCFSAVVGPNGSGKSNVIDAMLFVFGKRAKQLRLNKVSELIHQHGNANSARVSVYFQEIVDTTDGEFDIIPNTEVVVSRIAYRNNTSNYQLNGKTVPFQQVAEYLGAKGIDLDHNRFLILQGEVEMIAMMPPEGLLEYLEDIIGSHKFVPATEEAAEKVEALSQVRQEKLNRVKAVQGELDSLQSAKQEAMSLLDAERAIRRKQNIYNQLRAMEVRNEMESCERQLAEEKENLAAERSRISESQELLKEKKEYANKLTEEHERVLQEYQRSKEEFDAYDRKFVKLTQEKKSAKSNMKKLKKKKASLEQQQETLVAEKEAASQRIPELEMDIDQMQQDLADQDAAMEKMQEARDVITGDLRLKLDAQKKELVPFAQQKATIQAALDTAKNEMDLLSNITTKERLALAEEEYATLEERKTAKETELQAAEKERSDVESRLQKTEVESQKLQEMEAQLAKRSKDLVAASEQVKVAKMAQGKSKSAVVTAILKAAKKQGPLAKAGVVGRLGDLATISEEYDVAVNTACGSLDCVVVQTSAGAQECIKFLRKNGLGRANFIPLDKMNKGVHDRQVETPENAPKLIDLITPSHPSIVPALHHAIGTTLVAPDLETGTRWAYDYGKRWRVVTLDGKLIESSGSMSGGGKSVRRGGMKLSNGKVSEPVVDTEEEEVDEERIAVEIESVQTSLNATRQERKALSNEIRELSKRLKTLDVLIPKLSLEISGFETSRLNLAQSIPELRARCELTAAEKTKLENLGSEVSRLQMELSDCVHQAVSVEAKVKAIQHEIADAGGPEYKKQKALCEKTSKLLSETETALNAAKVTVGSSDKKVSTNLKLQEELDAELAELEAVYDELSHSIASLEEDAAKVKEVQDAITAEEIEKQEAANVASMEYEAMKQETQAGRLAEVQLAETVSRLEMVLTELSRRENRLAEDLGKLRAAAAADYEEYFDDNDGETSEAAQSETTASGQSCEDGDVQMEDTEGDLELGSSSRGELPLLSEVALSQYRKDDIQDEIGMLETERNAIAKNANMGAIAEYRKKEGDYLARVSELDAVTEERNQARRAHEDLRRQRLEMFMDGFGHITLKLKEMYQMITLGGDAELELVDSLDPFSEGIVFSVRPPKKSWKNISNLSGGEKTLSSLALVFALHHYKPTPLYVMDEIDAALDFKNVSIVANYIKDRTKNAQFIIISLRNNMFELADRLVGIYKTSNCTKSVTINPKAFGIEAQQNGVLQTPALAERTNHTMPVSSAKAVRRVLMDESESLDGIK